MKRTYGEQSTWLNQYASIKRQVQAHRPISGEEAQFLIDELERLRIVETSVRQTLLLHQALNERLDLLDEMVLVTHGDSITIRGQNP